MHHLQGKSRQGAAITACSASGPSCVAAGALNKFRRLWGKVEVGARMLVLVQTSWFERGPG